MAAGEASTTYLASIVIPLGREDWVESFRFDTWGVDVLAVCHIPSGWRITAGQSAAPEGVIVGEGSHGVTWLGDMKSLESLVLIRLYGPVQEVERIEGPTTHPANFAGKARLQTTDASREVALGHANLRLTPASRCP